MTEPNYEEDETVYYETVTMSPELEAASIAKLQAETVLATNEALLRQAETREAAARAVTEEQKAVIQGISRKERQRQEDLTMIGDHYVHHHFFYGGVDDRTVFGCLNTLAAWDRTDPTCPMNITINSPGGDVVDGMHLFDQIANFSKRGGGTHEVTITVRGYAASMAGILLQAADHRVIGKESYLMIHEISAGTGGKIGDIKDDVKWYDRVCDRVADIFVERAEGKISAEDFKAKWERHDWWLDSTESLRLGLVDRIG